MIKDILQANECVIPNKQQLEVLRRYFPGCFNKDGSFDIVRFQNEIKTDVNLRKEGYELNFLGKSYAKLLAALDTTTVIIPDKEHNEKDENKNSENIYITGDNLDALKHLLKSYAGKIKCIYIDPPYNTGSDGFVYNDKFNFTVEELMEKLSISEEEASRILELTDSGSASHSAWLTFIYPRLFLARDLLADDGVIFISIDDNEQADLKLLCDSIFGEENFISTITVLSNPRGRDYGGVAKCNDYVLVYSKSEDRDINLITDENGSFRMFDDISGFELRELRNRNIKFNKENRPNLYYPFYIDVNNMDENKLYKITLNKSDGFIELYPKMSQGIQTVWRWGKDKASQNLNTNIKAKKMRNGGWQIVEKYRESKFMARSLWNDKNVNTEKGTLLVKDLFNNKIFDYPKTKEMLKRIVEMGAREDSIILDFFSGSATTAHAVMELNAEDNGERKYIMVQLPEPTKETSIAYQAGYKTIDEIGRERIIRAAAKIKEDHPDTKADLGFKHYTLTDYSDDVMLLDKMDNFDPQAMFSDKPLLDTFGVSTALVTWLVQDGYGFNASYSTVQLAGYTAYMCGKHLYLINENFNNDALSSLVEKYSTIENFNPEQIVIFGYSFTYTELENLKINIKSLHNDNKNINIQVRY